MPRSPSGLRGIIFGLARRSRVGALCNFIESPGARAPLDRGWDPVTYTNRKSSAVNDARLVFASVIVLCSSNVTTTPLPT
jgi:hypothetical protein